MPSSYSTRLRFELIGVGEFGVSGNWGTTTNVNLGTLIEEAIAGIAPVPVTDGAATVLSAIDGGTDQSRQMIINLTGALTAQREVRCPAVQKLYFVRNATSGGHGVLFKTASGTGVVVPNGKIRAVYCDGTNVNDLITDLPAATQLNGVDITTISGTQTLTNKTLNSPRVDTAILDTNGNEAIRVAATASAVNEIQVVNAATTGTPSILATGNDTNIGINLIGKGTGQIFANSLPVVTTTGTQTLTNKTLTSPTLTSPSMSSISNSGTLTLPTGNVTIIGTSNGLINDAQIANATISNAKLVNTTISGAALGSNLSALTLGTGLSGTSYNGSAGVTASVNYGTTSTTACRGDDARLSDARTPTPHTHGNISNVGAIGSTANLPIITTTGGALTTGSFGSSANTFCQGNDGRLSDQRVPTDGSVTTVKIGDNQVTPAKLSQPLTDAGARTLTSQTFVEWTDIPSWVRRITVSVFDMTMPNSFPLIRLGVTSGGYITGNSYYWDCWNGNWVGASPRNGFWMHNNNNSADISGHFTITKAPGSNVWVASYTSVVANVGPFVNIGAGYIDLGQTLDKVTINNSALGQFASGAAFLTYE